jgi:hypothetical protein
LKETDWQQKLFCLDRDPALDGLFGALGDADHALGVETAERKRRAPALNPASEQRPGEEHDHARSHAALVVALARNPASEAVRARQRARGSGRRAQRRIGVLAGKTLGSGLGLPELAFLWARRLVLLRPEHRALALFQAGRAGVARARAQALGSSNGAARTLDGDAKLFLRALKRHLREPRMRGRRGRGTRSFRAAPLTARPGRVPALGRPRGRAAPAFWRAATSSLRLTDRALSR